MDMHDEDCRFIGQSNVRSLK